MAALFAEDIFKLTFLNEKDCILIEISLKLVPHGPIDNKSSLAQVMACRLTGSKPLSKPVLTEMSGGTW